MKMFHNETGAMLSYADVGHGACVLAIHGAHSTHHEFASALEPILAPFDSYRRFYPDLPGRILCQLPGPQPLDGQHERPTRGLTFDDAV